MAEGFSSPIELGLPGTPQGVPDELYEEFSRIYQAIRNLQQKLGEYAGTGTLDLNNYLNVVKPLIADSIQVHRMQAILVIASAAIGAGDFVNLHNSGGLRARQAIASGTATRAWGWAPAAIANGDTGVVFLLSGLNQAIIGMTIGTVYYLSSATPGGITSTRPVAAGTISQEMGIALSATELLVNIDGHLVVN